MHSIVYEFANWGNFKKKEMKAFIYEAFDKALLEIGFEK